MPLILTPPPTVMVFFKEISLKNESTVKNICGRWNEGTNGQYFTLSSLFISGR